MVTVRLSRGVWKYDPASQLGPRGGFGAVFRGMGAAGEEVAIKRLHVDAEAAGHRELRIADNLVGHRFRHVIPILDAGVDSEGDRYYVVMAKADGSLADTLRVQIRLPEDEALSVLDQIAAGLEEISELVHRDLKPGNVLLIGGRWVLADLGIAKFIEDSTSLNTVRDVLTAAYAAPEQWKLESSTKKTDVYALGCITHALVVGQPPFHGGTREELRQKHLKEMPPPLPASSRLAQLASMCLRKSPEARPDLASVRRQLAAAMTAQARESHRELASAAAAVARKDAEAESIQEVAADRNEARQQLGRDAVSGLNDILGALCSAIRSAAPAAKIHGEGTLGRGYGGGELSVLLGTGALKCRLAFPLLDEAFPASRWDVVSGAWIGVEQESNRYPGRSANLWYMRRPQDSEYRWWQVSYMSMFRHSRPGEPFGVETEDELRDADLAPAPITHNVQLGGPVISIDGEDCDAFVAIWSRRLAAAATSILPRPSSLPDSTP